MDIRNCIPVDSNDPKHNYYMIIDSKEHLANECFNRAGILVEYNKEYTKEEIPYIIRECRTEKGNERAFRAALRELMVLMRIKGYEDYREACEVMSKHAEMLSADPKGSGSN